MTMEQQPGLPPPGGSLSTAVVIFSKDRPLQLEGLLRSLVLHCWDLRAANVHVLYTTSTEAYQRHYEQVAGEYSWAHFLRERDFQADLLQLLQGSEHVFFLVDDTLVVRGFELLTVLRALQEQPEALGFSLRLGANTTYCYSSDKPQALPRFEPLENGLVRFAWTRAELDFGYPLEVSSSVYRTKDLWPLLAEITVTNPNLLESHLAPLAPRLQSQPFLLSFAQSAAFSAPLNRVQSVYDNRASDDLAASAEALASRFAEGQRVDAAAYAGFVPNACHQEIELKLRPRAERGPAVSVVIPCYNQAQYLPEAIQSVVAQTFSDWELIIVNDGSADNTSDVARKLAAQYTGRLIRLLEKPNGGLAEARNSGIRESFGRYILPLDADDKIAPAMLRQTTACLDAHPAVAIAYTDGVFFGAVNRASPTVDFDFGRLCAQNILLYCSLFRREVWQTLGGYRRNVPGYEDWDFWIGAAEKGLLASRVPEPLFFYRVKPQSMYTEAVERDLELRARIVLNHPALYNEPTRNWARAVLATPNPTPDAPAPPAPHEILCRAELLAELRKHTAHLEAELDALRNLSARNRRPPGAFWRKLLHRFRGSGNPVSFL